MSTGVAAHASAPPHARGRRRRARAPVLVMLAALFVVLVAVLCLLGPQLAPQGADAQNLALSVSTPSSEHLLGTDSLGHDVLSRLFAGARTSIAGAFVIALGAMLVGNAFGVLAGYRGGKIDAVIMRWVDGMYALPALLVTVVVAGVLGGGLVVAIAILVLLFSPPNVRLMRAATLEQRPLPYVEAARLLGLSGRRIMARHVWPNLTPLVVANTFLDFSYAIVTLAGLSFLGVGVDPSSSDWGRSLSDARSLLFDNPTAAIAPALMIVLTAASVTILGDHLFQRLESRGRAR
jgi:peptide/nickel transport system permease protein